MPKSNKKETIEILSSLPDKNDPNYFRTLVNNCVIAYEKLSNDGLALDYCMIADKKLRAMIMNDDEYKAKTKNIYARQRLEEMDEVEYLARLAANEDSDDDDDYYEPRDGKKSEKKITCADKDMMNMRFKAAQMKRELRAELATHAGNAERDTNFFSFVHITQEEFLNLLEVELHEGSEDDNLDSLTDNKEKVPEGTSGNMRMKGKTDVDDESFFKVLETGEVVEL